MSSAPRTRRRPPAALVIAAALTAAGCAGPDPRTAPPPSFEHDAPTLLAAGTGNLEGSASLRLTLRLKDPGGDGTVEREVALREVPDPTLKPFVTRLPDETAYDLWTDDGRLGGTAELSDFGAEPTVRQPTADQILHRPPQKSDRG